jgi:hypothetical protein
MHLSHEKMWIYGSLALTAVFFAVLMMLPSLTTFDNIGTPTSAGHKTVAPEPGHAGH